jgi:hypothetical protein
MIMPVFNGILWGQQEGEIQCIYVHKEHPHVALGVALTLFIKT